MGEATAKMNISDLKKILNLPESPDSDDQLQVSKSNSLEMQETDFSVHQRIHRVRRESMEQLNLIKVVGVYVLLCPRNIQLRRLLKFVCPI